MVEAFNRSVAAGSLSYARPKTLPPFNKSRGAGSQVAELDAASSGYTPFSS